MDLGYAENFYSVH